MHLKAESRHFSATTSALPQSEPRQICPGTLELNLNKKVKLQLKKNLKNSCKMFVF